MTQKQGNKKTITRILLAGLLAAMLLAACNRQPGITSVEDEPAIKNDDEVGENGEGGEGGKDGQITDITDEPEPEPEPEDEGVVIERVGEENLYDAEDGTRLFAADLYYPQVQMEKNQKAAGKINDYFAEVRSADVVAAAEYLEWATSEYEARLEEEEEFLGYAMSKDYILSFEGERLLSVKELLYAYTGGAHPYNQIKGGNFDLASGELIQLNDCGKVPEEFEAFLEQRVKEYLAQQESEDGSLFVDGLYEDYEELLQQILKNPIWYVTEGSIWLVFNQYEIAPYAAGIIEVAIPVEDCREYVTEENWAVLQEAAEIN